MAKGFHGRGGSPPPGVGYLVTAATLFWISFGAFLATAVVTLAHRSLRSFSRSELEEFCGVKGPVPFSQHHFGVDDPKDENILVFIFCRLVVVKEEHKTMASHPVAIPGSEERAVESETFGPFRVRTFLRPNCELGKLNG